ncbi:MAG: Gfo/Idh/MocA family protein [Kineosporiaceae bacterium]
MTGAADATVRWGFVGPGRIAAAMARELVEVVPDGTLQAVAGRSPERARAFADRFGAASAFAGPDAVAQLVSDPLVDVVYVATPHPDHRVAALAAVAAGKPVLVEKSFTATHAGAREVVEAARAGGVFCMEAMWTRFQPAVVRLRELLAEGAVGEVRSVRADLGLRRPFDPTDRLWDPERGGGALLDLAVYPVAFAQMVLGGAPDRVEAVGTLGPNGVDAESTVLLGFGDRHAVASSSLLTRLPGTAAVFGSDGWIEVPPRFHHPDRLVLRRRDGDAEAPAEVVTAPATGAGYSHTFAEVHRCLAAGLTESPVMPLADTLAVMAVLDAAAAGLGVSQAEAVGSR